MGSRLLFLLRLRWVREDEDRELETPLDQLKNYVEDTFIKPNVETLVSCSASVCSVWGAGTRARYQKEPMPQW